MKQKNICENQIINVEIQVNKFTSSLNYVIPVNNCKSSFPKPSVKNRAQTPKGPLINYSFFFSSTNNFFSTCLLYFFTLTFFVFLFLNEKGNFLSKDLDLQNHLNFTHKGLTFCFFLILIIPSTLLMDVRNPSNFFVHEA